MIYEHKFSFALALTLLVEIPVLLTLARFVLKISRKELATNKIIFLGVLASSLTLPYFWFILPLFIDSRHLTAVSEALIILIEALVYNQVTRIKFQEALFISAVANLSSFLLGELFL